MRSLRLGSVVLAVVAFSMTAMAQEKPPEGQGNNGGSASGDQLTIGYINWDEDVAVTHLWQKVLQDKGYNVRIQQVSDAGPTFVGLDKGDLDLFFDAWLPATHKTYWDKYGKDLTDISTWYDSAPLTIAVPKYVHDVNSMADLKAHAGEFGHTIVGIEPGAGLTRVTKTSMMPKYGLGDWTLKTSSTPAMLATLKKDIAEKKPVVVTLWRPHWAYSAFPIKDLQDPKGAMGKPDSILARLGVDLNNGFGDLVEKIKSFEMDDATLADLEKVVLQEHEDDLEAGVDAWMKDNQDFVDSMFQG